MGPYTVCQNLIRTLVAGGLNHCSQPTARIDKNLKEKGKLNPIAFTFVQVLVPAPEILQSIEQIKVVEYHLGLPFSELEVQGFTGGAEVTISDKLPLGQYRCIGQVVLLP